MTNGRYERVDFVNRVRETGRLLGYPDIFERWLLQAAAGDVFAVMSLKDYGLVPETDEEKMENLIEYATMIKKIN